MVEYKLPKLGVASSSLVARFAYILAKDFLENGLIKSPFFLFIDIIGKWYIAGELIYHVNDGAKTNYRTDQ